MRSLVGPATLLATAIALGAAGGGRLEAQESSRPVVAILDFTNSALVDHDVYEPFTVGIAGMLLAELEQNPDIRLVERERIQQVLEEIELGESGRVDRESAVRAGKILGAHYVITGGFVIDRRGTLRIDARAVSVETSLIEQVETVTDDADDLLRAVQHLGEQLSTSLDLPGEEAPAPEPEDARQGQVLANLKYARALIEEDRKNKAEAIELYRQFLADTPEGYAVVLRREAEERIRALVGSQR